MSHQEEISKQNEFWSGKCEQISAQKDQLQQLSEQVQQATQDKISFFTNITHEF